VPVPDAHKNFAYSTVLTPPSPGASGTSLVVQAGDGVKFPTPPFNVTIWPIGQIPLATNAEIARCTAISTDTLTLTRAQEGSSARTVVASDQIAASITAKTITDVETMMSYNGDFVAGNYADGDIVVYNGIAYLCTKPTNASPAAWPGGVTPAPAPFSIGYGTTLPVAPTDGQRYVLVDSLTAPNWQWEFRFNAGNTTAYKWELVGGYPLFSGSGGSYTNSAPPVSTWFDVSNPNPTLTVPRSGVYLLEFTVFGQSQATSGGYTMSSSVLASTSGRSGVPQMAGSAIYFSGQIPFQQVVGYVAGETLKVQGQVNASVSMTMFNAWIKLLPLRVA
jgi:hypothetical protein